MNKYRQLGNTNIEVCAVGLGAMPLSLDGRPDEAQALDVIQAFVATLELPQEAKDVLLALTPGNYTGNAENQARAIKEI